MADTDLQQRVIKLLSGKPKHTETVAKIIQTLRVPKKSLNIQLYKLQRQGRITKVQESPPVWGLAFQEGATGTALTQRITRSRRKSDSCDQNDKGDDQLVEKILEYLSGRQKPSKSLEIAKATGHARAHYVNTTLYGMQERGLINKLSGKPPSWVVAAGNNKVGPANAIEGSASIKFESSTDSSTSATSFPASGSGIPLFQDTELFKTELHFETEFDPSEAFTHVADGNESEEVDDESEDDDDTDMNSESIKKEAEQDNNFDSTTGVLRGDSPVSAGSGTDDDMLTQGTYKLFERSGGNISESQKITGYGSFGFDRDKRTEDEYEMEGTMEMHSSNFNMVNCKDEPSDKVIEIDTNLEEQRNELVEMEAENEEIKSQLVHDVPEFDRELIKKQRTFRDVFQLDEPISDDTSSSFDSAKDIDAELKVEGGCNDSRNVKHFAECHSGTDSSLESKDRKSTPEIPIVTGENETPEQKIVQSEWDTPKILDTVLDLQEDAFVGSVNDASESGQFRASNAEAVMPELYKNENELVNKSTKSTHELEIRGEINQVEMEDSNSGEQVDDNEEFTNESSMELTESGMVDCDIVLKVLQELKGIAQFVLKRKTDIPPENLDDVLQQCMSLNYVSGSAKLWKITDEGMEYISKKSGKSNSINESDKFMQPEKKVKPTFKGPPPSPMALLGKGTGASGKQSVSESVNKHNTRDQSSTLISHSQGSLFKQPMASGSYIPNLNLTGSSSVHHAVSDKSNSGPMPLMSLQFDSNSVNKAKFAAPSSGLGQSSAGQGKVQPLMSINLESVPIDKEALPQRSSNQMQVDQDKTNVQKYGETVTRTSQYPQNQQILNSALWGTAANWESSNGVNVSAKSQAVNSNTSSSQLFQSSMQTGSQNQTFGSQNQVQKLTQNNRMAAPLEETKKREIPSKYADYPNQGTSMLCLKSKTQSKSVNRSDPVCASKSAFSKGPPPSPLDIISKGLKKTEISPPSSYIDNISVSLPSGSFSTMSQTYRKAEASNQGPGTKSVFSVGQFAQTSSHSYSSGSGNKMEQTVNQSSFLQSGSIFGSQSKQSGFQHMSSAVTPGKIGNQSGSCFGSATARPVTGGPPPPPAVKLGLQVAQHTPAPVTIPKTSSMPNLSLALNTESFNALNKNPVSALMEYAQSRKMTARVEVLSRRGSSHKPTFELAAFVGDRRFPSVNCHNKKDGRKEACDIAMRQLVAEGQFKAEASSASGVSPVPSANMTHFDTIAALTHRGFTALVSQITAESFAGRKVIAGLVMKRSADDTGVLVSLGTGNRCITGPQLSLQGNTVNDSHAEIITRRGFLRFLYKQLLDFNPSRPHPMFERSSSGKLKIRPNITFHLYISTAPCGDGALFSPRDSESSKAPVDTRIRPPHEPTFSSNVQGILRTKVEGGEGTIPIEPGFKGQTFDGIQRGERLRTMSCTDKICRWNVVGMQGALLSHFLEPVYLDSLTLGLLYDHGHLSRAVCCRVGRGLVDVNTELPPGYQLNHPWLGRVTVCDPPREVQKTKALSVNWCFGDSGPEVTDGTLGLCYTSIEKGFFSRCSKRNLFTSFKSLCEKFGRQDLLQVSSYNEAKVAAQDFVNAKQVMLKRFKENSFGKWVSKPVEEEMFGFEEQK